MLTYILMYIYYYIYIYIIRSIPPDGGQEDYLSLTEQDISAWSDRSSEWSKLLL